MKHKIKILITLLIFGLMGAGLLMQLGKLKKINNEYLHCSERWDNEKFREIVHTIDRFGSDTVLGNFCGDTLTDRDKWVFKKFGYAWLKEKNVYSFWHLDSINDGRDKFEYRRGNFKQAY